MNDDFFEEIDYEDDGEECQDEPDELDFDEGKDEPATEHEYLDPFYLGVAAGFGYEMGKEERRRKKK